MACQIDEARITWTKHFCLGWMTSTTFRALGDSFAPQSAWMYCCNLGTTPIAFLCSNHFPDYITAPICHGTNSWSP
jgi:hypothetical protein